MRSNKRTGDFLRECMADALIALMQSKAISKVTVNEIAELAGVNRSTWFRSFETKSDALAFKLVQLWYRWADEHGINKGQKYTLSNAADFFRFNYEYRDLIKLLVNCDLQACVYTAFYEIMAPQFESDAAECYESRFNSYGLFGLLVEWNKREYKQTPEEMVNIFYNVMEQAQPSNSISTGNS